MTLTHCLPNGTLGTDEIPVCNIGPASLTLNRPGGLIRGVVVNMHGLGKAPATTPEPVPVANDPTVPFQNFEFQLMNSLTADHWAYMPVNMPEDFYSLAGGAATAIFNDINNDTTHGSRFMQMTLHWWDHLVLYVNQHIAAGLPIIAFGGSGGGWHTLTIAQNRSSTIGGYACYIPATIFPTISTAFLPGIPFNTINCDGMIVPTTALDLVTVPGLVSYGTNDEVVGWAATTVGPGSNGVPVSSFSGSGVLNVQSVTHLTTGPSVLVTGLTGGTHEAVIKYTGTTGSTPGTLTGCTTTYGSGTLNTGTPVAQNNVDAIITNAQFFGQPVTRLATTDFHEFTSSTATSFSNWFASVLDPLFPAVF